MFQREINTTYDWPCTWCKEKLRLIYELTLHCRWCGAEFGTFQSYFSHNYKISQPLTLLAGCKRILLHRLRSNSEWRLNNTEELLDTPLPSMVKDMLVKIFFAKLPVIVGKQYTTHYREEDNSRGFMVHEVVHRCTIECLELEL